MGLLQPKIQEIANDIQKLEDKKRRLEATLEAPASRFTLGYPNQREYKEKIRDVDNVLEDLYNTQEELLNIDERLKELLG